MDLRFKDDLSDRSFQSDNDVMSQEVNSQNESDDNDNLSLAYLIRENKNNRFYSVPLHVEVNECFNCGLPDHWANKCSEPKVTCENCEKDGHLAMYCRQISDYNKNVLNQNCRSDNDHDWRLRSLRPDFELNKGEKVSMNSRFIESTHNNGGYKKKVKNFDHVQDQLEFRDVLKSMSEDTHHLTNCSYTKTNRVKSTRLIGTNNKVSSYNLRKRKLLGNETESSKLVRKDYKDFTTQVCGKNIQKGVDSKCSLSKRNKFNNHNDKTTWLYRIEDNKVTNQFEDSYFPCFEAG